MQELTKKIVVDRTQKFFEVCNLNQLEKIDGAYLVYPEHHFHVKFYISEEEKETEKQKELAKPKKLKLMCLFDKSDIDIIIDRKDEDGEIKTFYGVICENIT